MDMEKIRSIAITSYILDGILPLGNKFEPPLVYGFDTETVKGKLHTMQVWNPERSDYVVVEDETGPHALTTELERLEYFLSLAQPKGITIFFAHVLTHDLGVTFPKMCVIGEEFGIEKGEIKLKEECNDNLRQTHMVKMFYPKPAYMSIRSKNRRVIFMDSVAWFQSSLAKASALIGHTMKLERPEYLGERFPSEKEKPYFKQYAMMDAEITYFLGKKIEEVHKKYNSSMKFSVRPSSMGARLFRKDFLDRKIPYPPSEIEMMGLKSYWGGRTEAFGYGRFNGVKVYDYNSFYPHAMRNIKLPIENDWQYVEDYQGVDGFYEVSGKIPWMFVSPLPYRTDKLFFPIGKFSHLTVTGHEMANILEYGKEIQIHKGYVYEGKSSSGFRKYVDHFYEKKANAEDEVYRKFYKLLLNSVYGKTIQSIPARGAMRGSVFDNDKNKLKLDKTRYAGGLFNPAIASWITGFCRAQLFRDMKAVEKHILYCDTDSMIVRENAPILNVGSKIGQFKEEFHGDIIIVREKVYLLIKDGKLRKSASHGFLGTADQLYDIIEGKASSYGKRRMVQLREGIIRKIQPFMMEEKTRKLSIYSSKKRAAHSGRIGQGVTLDPLEIGG